MVYRLSKPRSKLMGKLLSKLLGRRSRLSKLMEQQHSFCSKRVLGIVTLCG